MFPPGANWEYNANPLSLVETFENSLKYTLEFFEYRYKYMYIRWYVTWEDLFMKWIDEVKREKCNLNFLQMEKVCIR